MTPESLNLGTSRVTGTPETTAAATTNPEPAPGTPVASTPVADAPGSPATAPAEPLTWEQTEDLRQKIVAALCTCFDPEIPVNIYELGLVYELVISPEAAVTVRMTLTSPACPVAGTLPGDVQHKVQSVPGVASAKVDLVWEPPWDKNRMSEAAKLQLGIDDM